VRPALDGDTTPDEFIRADRTALVAYASCMSIPVAIDDLAAAIEQYRWAYLLTVRDDLRAHIVAVRPAWDGGELVMEVGRGTARNASERRAVSLCYPPTEPDGYSLIIDGDASVDGESVVRTLGPGEGFGEIALLRDVPRTATITTTDDTVLLAIDRDHFMGAVMGRAEATVVADSVVGARLGRDVDR
jgi:hypothetical protein